MSAAPSFVDDPELSGGQRFALGVSAIQAKLFYRLGHAWLHGVPPGTGGRSEARGVLWMQFSVACEEDARDQLDALARKGGVIAQTDSSMVARLAASAGYLDDHESWRWVLRVARDVHAGFSSWRELARAWLIAHKAARGAPNDEARAVVRTLLDPAHPTSPWREWPAVLIADPPTARPRAARPAPPPLPPRRAFAMALAAPLVITCGGDQAWFRLGPPGVGAEAGSYRGLVHDWGVRVRAEVVPMLTWLAEQGHRAGYEEIAAGLVRLGPLTDVEIEALRPDVQVVARHRAGHPSIEAFDLARLVIVARDAAACGLLGEAEAWEWVLAAGKLAARTFASWEEYGANFQVGVRYFDARQGEGGPHFEKAVDWLLDHPRGSWREVPWAP